MLVYLALLLQVVNQKHSDSGSLKDKIPVFEVELLHHANDDDDDDEASPSTTDHQGAVLSKKLKSEVCF